MSEFKGAITITGTTGSIIQIGDRNKAVAEIEKVSQEVADSADWQSVVKLLSELRAELNALPDNQAELRDTTLIPATASALKAAKEQQEKPEKGRIKTFIEHFTTLASGLASAENLMQVAPAIVEKVKAIAAAIGLNISLW